MGKWTVYKHTCPKGKVYIGITSTSAQRRWKGGHGYVNNIHFYRAINKYGWGSFKHEILAEKLTKEEATAKEIELIRFYNSTDWRKGYNREPGGNLVSNETRLKISKALTGKPLSASHIEKMRISKRGVPVAKDVRKKISENLKNNPRVLSHINKLNAARKGVPKSNDHKRKISESQPSRQRVINLTTGETFSSLSEAAEIYGVHRPNISKVCAGIRETAGGFKWAYMEDKTT